MNDNKLTWTYCIDCMSIDTAVKAICVHCGEECMNLGSDYQEFKQQPLESVKIEKVA